MNKETSKWLLCGVATAGIIALFWLTPAKADPPPNGWYGSLSGHYVVCDTADQIKEISDAGAEGGDKLVAKFKEYLGKKNEKGEPTCVYAPVEEMAVGESKYIGESTAQSGQRAKAYAVHIGNSSGDWWFLYGEAIPDKKPTPSSFGWRQWDWHRVWQRI